jgi:hypothetical protein
VHLEDLLMSTVPLNQPKACNIAFPFLQPILSSACLWSSPPWYLPSRALDGRRRVDELAPEIMKTRRSTFIRRGRFVSLLSLTLYQYYRYAGCPV